MHGIGVVAVVAVVVVAVMMVVVVVVFRTIQPSTLQKQLGC
jgi:hypothetical protein